MTPPGTAADQGLDAARLVAVLGELEAALERAARQAGGAAAGVAPLRSTLDGLGDQLRLLSARSREVTTTGVHAREALERIRLIALNLALEGARVGDTLGQVILAIAEEVRVAATRGIEASGQQADLLARFEDERGRLAEQVDQVRARGEPLAQELLAVQGSVAEAQASARAARELASRHAGHDPETARLVLAAAEHAAGLLGALDALGAVSETASGRAVLDERLAALAARVVRLQAKDG